MSLSFGTYNPPPLTFKERETPKIMLEVEAGFRAQARRVNRDVIHGIARQIIARPTWADVLLPGLRQLPRDEALRQVRFLLKTFRPNRRVAWKRTEAFNLRAAELVLRYARRWEARIADMEASAPQDPADEAFPTYEVQVDAIGRVEAIFTDGAKTGARVFGRSENGMHVTLKADDLPFDVRSLPQTNAGTYDATARGIGVYALTAGQRQQVADALAAKIAASEGLSRTAPAALAIRDPR